MIIEDHELRTLFKAESEEHLQLLDNGLLRLEDNPADPGTIAELFRAAHSLKGAARMLGVTEVEKVAHRFEDVLSAAKYKGILLTPAVATRMYRALDPIRRLVAQAVTGQPSGVDVDQVIFQLDEGGEAAPAESVEQPAALEQAEAKPVESSSGTHKMQTIRVELSKLDLLMNETGELIVTKTRIARRSAQFDHLIGIWEEWNQSRKGGHSEDFGELLYRLRDDFSEDTARLEFAVSRIDEGVRAVRLLPLSTIFNMFRGMARDIAKDQKKEVQLIIQGGETVADKQILEEMKDPLMHMIRNAVDHGIESPSRREECGKPRMGTIRLSAASRSSSIIIELADDGRGLSEDSIKQTALKRKIACQEELDHMTPHEIRSLIFKPGFSTSATITDLSGRGVGLDVVRTNVERLKGTIAVESSAGAGCTMRIQLPATLSTSRVLLVGIAGLNLALPLEYIHSTRLLAVEDLFTIEGSKSILVDKKPVPVARLCDLLQIPTTTQPVSASGQQRQSCVIVSAGEELLGLIVDELLDEQEVILKPHGGLLKRVRNVSGSAILGTGAVCTVLNPLDLLRSVRKGVFELKLQPPRVEESAKPRILLVEDSITTRTWEKRGLESGGYEVVTAVDGIEALEKLNLHSFSAVVSDVEMPRMGGLTLTERNRQDKKHKELPVILVTSLADDDDKRRGIEAGANAYITKSAFEQALLIETLKRLV